MDASTITRITTIYNALVDWETNGGGYYGPVFKRMPEHMKQIIRDAYARIPEE